MISREITLGYMAAGKRFSCLTAGEALVSLTPTLTQSLAERDRHFFKSHAEEPCHDVARACSAGHVWRGDENRKWGT